MYLFDSNHLFKYIFLVVIENKMYYSLLQSQNYLEYPDEFQQNTNRYYVEKNQLLNVRRAKANYS